MGARVAKNVYHGVSGDPFARGWRDSNQDNGSSVLGCEHGQRAANL